MTPGPDDAAITSLQNPRIKAAVRLRDRRERDEALLTLVDGAREVRRALDAGAAITEAFVADELLHGADAAVALAALQEARVPVLRVSRAVMEKLAFGDRLEGLVAVLRIPPMRLADLVPGPGPLLAVVEGVEKPGNLGAILRSADGAGLDAVIVASPRTDLFNPNAIRASLGTIFAMPLATAPTADVLAWLAAHRIRPLVARVDARRLHTDADLTGPVAIVLGSEASGLAVAWEDAGAEAIRLPMLGIADSLNVSVAAAVLFYEARRQRGLPSSG